MENLFMCHHEEKSLKPGKDSTKILTSIFHKHINLPKEVIAVFVRCRMFFRIRTLNRDIISARSSKRKYAKLISKVGKDETRFIVINFFFILIFSFQIWVKHDMLSFLNDFTLSAKDF